MNLVDSGSFSQTQRLLEWMASLGRSVAIAFSGGVDSAVVAKAAHTVLGDRAIAVTGIGPALSERDLQDARLVAAFIGIHHLELPTQEIANPNYQRNDSQRCYHCKSQLYSHLHAYCKEHQVDVILSGTNRDDLGDYRPGLKAAKENAVRAPLAELEIGKDVVRQIAEFWQLPVADKPASPCLASRIAYGESVTVEKLRAIEQGEAFLRSLGLIDVRVRWHAGGLARIEVERSQLPRILDPNASVLIDSQFRKFGFKFVTIDLAGLQSGSLNRMLPILQ